MTVNFAFVFLLQLFWVSAKKTVNLESGAFDGRVFIIRRKKELAIGRLSINYKKICYSSTTRGSFFVSSSFVGRLADCNKLNNLFEFTNRSLIEKKIVYSLLICLECL